MKTAWKIHCCRQYGKHVAILIYRLTRGDTARLKVITMWNSSEALLEAKRQTFTNKGVTKPLVYIDHGQMSRGCCLRYQQHPLRCFRIYC